MEEKGPLDADAVGDAADGEVRAGAGVASLDHDALKRLESLLVTLDDFGADAHGVAHVEIRHRRVHRRLDDAVQVHVLYSVRSKQRRPNGGGHHSPSATHYSLC